MKKSTAYFALALVIGLAFSCKKDDSTTTPPYLGGLDIEEDPVPYVAPGTRITLKADVSDIYTSDNTTPGESIGLYWMINGESYRDTTTRNIKTSNPEFVYEAKGIGSVTIYCYAYSKGYTNASASVSFDTIDPETSISGLEGETTLIDGKKFYVADIDGTTWMTSNLYNTQSGISFHLASVTDSFLGRYYTWEEARSACPEGWRLPTAQEWDALGDDACALMVDATVLDKQMWPYWPNMPISNSKKFNSIPAGYVDRSGGDKNVQGYKSYAAYWTASEAEDDASLAQFRYIYSEDPKVQKKNGGKTSLALSVRCIKN